MTNSQDDRLEEKKVLLVTSVAEFAERYSYYVIQSLLIFYLIQKFGIIQADAASLVGTTLAMIYISAILGGYIAENLIGYYRAAFVGAIMLVAGTYMLAISSDKNILYLALGFISISTGLIKSNMGSFIGRFYDRSDLNHANRDFGFNIFYMGINLGSFFALLIATSLKDKFGYSAPFYSSMIVSTLMLLFLIFGFGIVNRHIRRININFVVIFKTIALILIYLLALFEVFKHPMIAQFSILIAFIASALILFISATKAGVNKVLIACVFFLLSIVFWALYFQIFISLLLFTGIAVNDSLVNSSQILSIESLSVLVFAFVMGKVWIYFANKGREVHDIDKFNFAFITIAIVFIIVLCSILLSSDGEKVSVFGFAIAYIVLAISELSLSAIGLSLVTKVAPKGFVALYMGIWMVTLGIGGKIGGFLASLIVLPKVPDGQTISSSNLIIAKANMADGLDMFIAIAIITAIVIFMIRKYIIENDQS